jgi:hypothetical protein
MRNKRILIYVEKSIFNFRDERRSARLNENRQRISRFAFDEWKPEITFKLESFTWLWALVECPVNILIVECFKNKEMISMDEKHVRNLV